MMTGILMFFSLGVKSAFAGNEDIVKATFEAISVKDVQKVMPYLADNFTMAGQQGEIAVMVFRQLVMQINETVISWEKTGEKSENGNTVLTYKTQYQKLGEKESKFVISADGKLVELSLFEMRVKTMEGEAEVMKSDRQLIELPFEMNGNLIALEAELNGKKRKFLLDSGSPKLILNAGHYGENEKETADAEGQKHMINQSEGVGGSIAGIDIGRIESFNLAGIRMKDQQVIVVDLTHLERELDTEIYGLIGYDVIRNYDLMFDYKNKKLVLIDPEVYGDFLRKHSGSITDALSLEMVEHIPVVSARIDGEVYRMGIDCGAENNLMDVRYFEKLKPCLSKLTTDSLAGADANIQVVQKGRINKMKIGGTNFKNTEALFSDMSHFGEGMDGLIGYEILSKQPTILSFSSGQMIFLHE